MRSGGRWEADASTGAPRDRQTSARTIIYLDGRKLA
jgi:hypothetical protein